MTRLDRLIITKEIIDEIYLLTQSSKRRILNDLLTKSKYKYIRNYNSEEIDFLLM